MQHWLVSITMKGHVIAEINNASVEMHLHSDYSM